MKAGVIGLVDGDFDVVDSLADTVDVDGRTLERCFEIDRVFSTGTGRMAFAGRAAGEFVRDGETPEIDDGEIRLRESPRTETCYTEFVGIPGDFVVVGSGQGTFAFDLIGQETGTTIRRATLDLDGVYNRQNGARPWKAGFYGNGDGGASGIFHGTDLRESHDIDGILRDSTLNQLGLAYEYDTAELKMTASRSGYVEVYQPSEFDSKQYLDYLADDIVPHLS